MKNANKNVCFVTYCVLISSEINMQNLGWCLQGNAGNEVSDAQHIFGEDPHLICVTPNVETKHKTLLKTV